MLVCELKNILASTKLANPFSNHCQGSNILIKTMKCLLRIIFCLDPSWSESDLTDKRLDGGSTCHPLTSTKNGHVNKETMKRRHNNWSHEATHAWENERKWYALHTQHFCIILLRALFLSVPVICDNITLARVPKWGVILSLRGPSK